MHLLRLLLQLGVGVQLGPDLLLGDRHPGVHELVEEPLLDQLGPELGAELVHRLVPLGEERLEFLGRPVGAHALEALLNFRRGNLQATLRSLLDKEESVHARLEHGVAKRRELIRCGHAGPVGQLERTSELSLEFRPGEDLSIDPCHRGGARVLGRPALAAGGDEQQEDRRPGRGKPGHFVCGGAGASGGERTGGWTAPGIPPPPG